MPLPEVRDAHIPSKFIRADGQTLWLCYAANFSSGWGGIKFKSRPPGSRYGMCLQEVRLLAPGDGTTIHTGALPDDAKRGLEVNFAPKTVKWLAFFVTGCKPGSPNVGLSEIATFKPRQ